MKPFSVFCHLMIQHIPDVGFRMIRYYGFLANRNRGKLLPIVYKLLNQEQEKQEKSNPKSPPTYTELIQKNFGFDPKNASRDKDLRLLAAEYRAGCMELDQAPDDDTQQIINAKKHLLAAVEIARRLNFNESDLQQYTTS